MKKQSFSFGDKASPEELNRFLHEMLETSGEFINKTMMLNGDELPLPMKEMLSPDTYGAERLFIEHFVNDEMGPDFPLIARDFFIHEFSHISEYEDVEYLDIDHGEDWPELMFIRFTLTLMLNAVNSGSEYTKSLFIYLYRTYYKKEYKVLKRFSSISSGEVLSLAEPQDGNTSYYGNLARVLCIAKMTGITINPDCNHIYAFLNDFSDRLDSHEYFSFQEATGDIFQESLKEIEEKYDSKKLYSLDGKVAKFLGNALKWLGYAPDFVDWCDENELGLNRRLATTLSILKKTFPNKEVSLEELIIYSNILHCASALTCNMDWMADTLKTLAYGENGTYYYEEFPSMFHPDDITVKEKQNVKRTVIDQTKKSELTVKEDKKQYSEDALVVELEILRRKVHKLETENSNLRVDLVNRRSAEEEARAAREQLDASGRELAALRDYVYNLTEEDNPAQMVSLEKMKEVISKKRIVIIGGHSNWVSKMKSVFPDWTFINPEASGSTDPSIVDKADYVYFFTDTISHSKYYQFMNVVRERKVDFGYIHGVNIEKNIRSIYRDFEE